MNAVAGTASGRQAHAGTPLPDPPSDLLDELVAVSHHFGNDPEFARGGGGNASVKADGTLYIKASGTSLATLTAGSLIPLDMALLLPLLDAEGSAGGLPGSEEVMRAGARARLGELDGRRPSVELLFHALLPERFVLHTHPTTVNHLTCSTGGAELTERLFGERALWIPYIDPGLPLARAIRDARVAREAATGRPAPHVLLLQNHGLVVAADSTQEIVGLSMWVVGSILEEAARRPAFSWGEVERVPPAELAALVEAIAPSLRALLSAGDRLAVVTFDDSPIAVEVAGSELGRSFATAGPLTPDQIVYAGSQPLLLDALAGTPDAEILPRLRTALERRAAGGAEPPIIVVARGLGLFAVSGAQRQADTARLVFLDAMRVSMGAHQFGGVRPLDQREQRFIEQWEAEAYRKQVSAGGSTRGRALGLVALVTGAAQGFGLALASDLVAQGAHVVLADINDAGAEKQARDLCARHGAGRAMAVPLDVTNEELVTACFSEAVRAYGGVDVVVSNAGILRAGAVTSQPIAEFDAVTRINYRGYFLCVRHAAPILARQHRANPAFWGNIVEINSKSGLAGSSRNSAYAGSKFGGIGLTQSFALELVGEGIKVNAICPGNFFEGPLWSDPENGLFVQYLREGKVPGAQTIDDVRRFYEAKVPMGRGCTPADVLEALYYVIEQRYETGQAIPVTGGQVMLS